MSTPLLHLRTLFLLDGAGRIVSTREPVASRAPLFSLVRGAASRAWAVGASVPNHIAAELDRLAAEEPLDADFRRAPLHAAAYRSLVGNCLGSETGRTEFHGPAFSFPHLLARPRGVVLVDDERLLESNFQGWVRGEIAEGRAPLFAVAEDGHPVSICFCARRSDVAAEAGVETAASHRGRGFATRVVAAWAASIRAGGRVPLYSTSWSNDTSLAVARKLGLVAYASNWSL